MYKSKVVLNLIWILLFSILVQAQTVKLTDHSGLHLSIDSNGTVNTIELDNEKIQPGLSGGFFLREPNSTKKVAMLGKTISKNGKLYLTLTSALQANVSATVTEGNGYIEFEGELENLSSEDRGLWLGFNVPVNTTGWKWGHNLVGTNPVVTNAAPGYSGDDRLLIPIPAVWRNNGGIALSIPPTNPCVFENTADAAGLRIQMAFGLSPITAKFPSKAPFRFRIYSINGIWGFRDALSKYYDWYPDYYSIEPSIMKRLNHRRDWLTMNYENLEPSKNDQATIASPQLGEWSAYTKITARPQSMRGVDLTTITPTNTQGYLGAIYKCTDILHYGRKSPGNDPSFIEARAAISNCAAYHPDGSWSMEEDAAIGSLDIGHNVSPNLFKDVNHPNSPIFGDMYLRRPAKLIGFNPNFTFMHWDRLGGRSAIVNYRREHFAYASHPLTFDQLGRICLPTQFSNYELFDAFRLQTKLGGMFHEGAGMKEFKPKNATEMLGGQNRVGLFFLSSVLESAWTEGGEKFHALGEYDSFRIFMGRKSYRIACDEIPIIVAAGQTAEALATVKRALANATAYGFASVVWDAYFYPNSHPLYDPAKGSVFYSPEHQALWSKYIPASEAIRLAGWEPVTYAIATSDLVEIQRFGRGDTVYLTVWGPSAPSTVEIEVDSAGLGLINNPTISEIVSDASIVVEKSAKGWKLRFSMEPDMTRVIKIQKNDSPLAVISNQIDKVDDVIVYPNPTKSIINFKSSQDIKSIELCDMSGKLIMRTISPKNSVDISSVQKGTYLLKIILDNGIIVKKISKN